MTVTSHYLLSRGKGNFMRTRLAIQQAGCVCLLSLSAVSLAHAQTKGINPVLGVPMQAAPQVAQAPPVLLTMPLVSAADGLRFQQQRQVTASDVPQKLPPRLQTADASASTPSGAVVALEKSALGHALPTTNTTPIGLPRADFAIAKPGKGASMSVQAAGKAALDNATGVSQAVIQ